MCNLVIIIRYSSICVISIAIYTAYWKITRLNFCKYLGEIVPFLIKSIIKSIKSTRLAIIFNRKYSHFVYSI